MSDAEDYKELAKEVNVLRNDLAKSAAAGKFTSSANRSALGELKSRQSEVERRLRELEAFRPIVDLRLRQLETKDKEHTGKIQTFEVTQAREERAIHKEQEVTKRFDKQWGVYAAIAVALITGLFNLLTNVFGGN